MLIQLTADQKWSWSTFRWAASIWKTVPSSRFEAGGRYTGQEKSVVWLCPVHVDGTKEVEDTHVSPTEGWSIFFYSFQPVCRSLDWYNTYSFSNGKKWHQRQLLKVVKWVHKLPGQPFMREYSGSWPESRQKGLIQLQQDWHHDNQRRDCPATSKIHRVFFQGGIKLGRIIFCKIWVYIAFLELGLLHGRIRTGIFSWA